MRLVLFTICVLLICSRDNVYGQECSDCVLYTNCENASDRAINMRNTETGELFRKALCGFEYIHGTRVPKVCCSQFGQVKSDDPIESHRNVVLLPVNCGDINGNKIIGGTVANIYEFPWMALISHETSYGLDFRCAGSIINSRYILTAAHCVENKLIAGVRIGEYDIRYNTDCQGTYPHFFCESNLQDILVEDSEIPAKEEGERNDIALLRLKKPIDFSHRNAAPICLPVARSLRELSLPGNQAVVAGWGLTEVSSESSVLKKVDIPILEKMDCYRERKPGATKREFCAGSKGKDSCTGDSGGPLMVEGEYRKILRYVQYGIVSGGPGICASIEGGLYTDVTKYMQWILDKIKA